MVVCLGYEANGTLLLHGALAVVVVKGTYTLVAPVRVVANNLNAEVGWVVINTLPLRVA